VGLAGAALGPQAARIDKLVIPKAVRNMARRLHSWP
jgi:hypothetical protein